MAAEYNLFMSQGETYLQTFTYQDSSGNYVDLTGYQGQLDVLKNRALGEDYITFSTQDNASAHTTMTLNSSGLISVRAESVLTAAPGFSGTVPYVLQLLAPDGITVIHVLYGTITSVPGAEAIAHE